MAFVPRAALLCFCWALSACAPEGPDPETEADLQRLSAELETKAAEAEQSQETIASLEAEVEGLREENAKLRSMVEVLRLKEDPNEALEAAREETRRYREGLERAVNELNRQARRPRPDPSRQPPRSSRPEASDRNVFVEEPTVFGDGQGMFVVEGTIHNANEVGIGGYLEIILTIDGRHAASTTLTMDLEPNTVHNYDHAFNAVTRSGVVEVVAVWGSGR